MPNHPEEHFELEAEKPGTVPPRVIEELRRCYREAKDYASAFGDALKAQAAKHDVEPAALRRYIAALENDGLEDAVKEITDLTRLIDEGVGA